MTYLLTLLTVVILVALVFVAYGRERCWRSLFGDPDLGPLDPAALRNRGRINQYLLCPQDMCPQALPAGEVPTYPVPTDALKAAFRKAAAADSLVGAVSGKDEDELRFVARSALMRYPDTISILVYETEGGSSAAIYSRSQIGRSDFGVNKARVTRWLARVERMIAPAR